MESRHELPLRIRFGFLEVPGYSSSRLGALLNSGRVELLDQRRLLAQLASLERRTTRVRVRHYRRTGPRDCANAAAGALVHAAAPNVVKVFGEQNFANYQL